MVGGDCTVGPDVGPEVGADVGVVGREVGSSDGPKLKHPQESLTLYWQKSLTGSHPSQTSLSSVTVGFWATLISIEAQSSLHNEMKEGVACDASKGIFPVLPISPSVS